MTLHPSWNCLELLSCLRPCMSFKGNTEFNTGSKLPIYTIWPSRLGGLRNSYDGRRVLPLKWPSQPRALLQACRAPGVLCSRLAVLLQACSAPGLLGSRLAGLQACRAPSWISISDLSCCSCCCQFAALPLHIKQETEGGKSKLGSYKTDTSKIDLTAQWLCRQNQCLKILSCEPIHPNAS